MWELNQHNIIASTTRFKQKKESEKIKQRRFARCKVQSIKDVRYQKDCGHKRLTYVQLVQSNE
jgi:hypothetical protein